MGGVVAGGLERASIQGGGGGWGVPHVRPDGAGGGLAALQGEAEEEC